MIATLICPTCKGARWVCAEHPLSPWHVGHMHCESYGAPCDACNHGPEFLGWSTNCLECATPDAFCAANPEDPDVIVASLDFTTEVLVPDPRIEVISAYFTGHMATCGSPSIAIAPDRWEIDTSPDPLGLHKPYGWMPPRPLDFVLAYCPEMIAEQTAELSDEQLQEYLAAVGFCISMHIQHHQLPPEDRERLIDRTLYDIGPGSMELLNMVQMRVMDARTEGK